MTALRVAVILAIATVGGVLGYFAYDASSSSDINAVRSSPQQPVLEWVSARREAVRVTVSRSIFPEWLPSRSPANVRVLGASQFNTQYELATAQMKSLVTSRLTRNALVAKALSSTFRFDAQGNVTAFRDFEVRSNNVSCLVSLRAPTAVCQSSLNLCCLPSRRM